MNRIRKRTIQPLQLLHSKGFQRKIIMDKKWNDENECFDKINIAKIIKQ